MAGLTLNQLWRVERVGPREREVPGLLTALEISGNQPEISPDREITRVSLENTLGNMWVDVGNPGRMTCPPRFATSRRPDRATYGARVAEIALELGTPLMPWQRYVADVALEIDPTSGMLAYRDVVLTVPRQSGKTTLLLAIMVFRALATQALGGPQVIDYTAQNRLYARKKWEDEHVAAVQRSAFGELCRIRKSMAMEAILWHNGSRHQIISGTETAAHGEVVDLGVIDEAFAQRDFRLEQALKPAMQTRTQAQLWIVSTAGDGRSVFLRSKVDAGRELTQRGQDRGICYFEWSAEESEDPSSVETWKRCMPALRHPDNPRGTTTIDTVRTDFETMELPEFKRAYLNLWDARRGQGVISPEDWQLGRVPRSQPQDPVVLAFDISPEHRSGAIAAAGESSASPSSLHVEIVDHRSGSAWMVDRLVELVLRHHPKAVVCDGAGPAGSLLPALQAAGIEVTVATTRDHIHACGLFYQGVTGEQDPRVADTLHRRIVHLGQVELNEAVAGADRRQVNDAWLWTRRTSNADISPLVAATLAAWGHVQAPELEVVTNPALSVW